jgi:hypothetical protein
LVKAVCAKYSLGRRRDALLTRQVDEGGEDSGLDGTSAFLL